MDKLKNLKRFRKGIIGIVLAVLLIPAEVFAAEPQKVKKSVRPEYCHGVTISEDLRTNSRGEEEFVYTMKSSGKIKPSYFVVNGKKVVGTLVDEYTMTYISESSPNWIYGIGEETPNSTYTVDSVMGYHSHDGMIYDWPAVKTYSSDEAVTYTFHGEPDARVVPGYFFINWDRVEGTVVDEYTLSYTFPKGTTGVYQIMPMPGAFFDVRKTDWFYQYVIYAKEEGLMEGVDYNIFAPVRSLARAQFAQILYRMDKSPKTSFVEKFKDVHQKDWYGRVVTWASGTRVVTGYSDGRFGPDENITREQMAVMMYRYAGYKGYDTKARESLSAFPDEKQVSGYAKEAMEWCVASGIISGQGEKEKILNPQGNTSRAECAAIIQRFVKKYESEK